MRIKQNIIRLALAVLILTAAVMTPFSLQEQTVSAQPDKISFYMNVIGNFPSNLTPGKDNLFYVQLNNDGSSLITNIHFNTTAPESWAVSFNPDTIDTLSAGNYLLVKVNIIPDNSIQGYQNITLMAQANEALATTSIYTRVTTVGVSLWLWVGIGIVALVIAGFAVVFIKQGKL